MAKGRKLTASRSERLLGSYGHASYGQGTLTVGSELGEEDVWSMVDDMVTADDQQSNGPQSEWIRSRRRVPHNGRHVGGLSLAFDESTTKAASPMIVHQYSVASPRGRHMATSAPVNVPDWSKIYRVDSVESMHDSDDGGDEPEMVPPHEYLARSRKLAANSVYEGVGRTLKGRDMSRVRDAVWSQTGFDG